MYYMNCFMDLKMTAIKKITIKDVARLASVGVSTVSAVLSGKEYCYVSEATKLKIKEAADNLGYIPNRMSQALHGIPTCTIGFIGSIFSVPIHTEFISHLSKLFWENDYQVLLGDSFTDQAREKALVKEFISRGVDGLVMSGTLSREDIRKIAEKVPFVVSGTMDLNSKLELGVDLEHGGCILTKHLLEKRASKIIFFTNDLKTNQSKYNGCLRAVNEDERNPVIEEVDCDIEKGMELCLLKFRSGNADAFICSNDILAAKLIAFFMDNKVNVPEDVLVAGYDGLSVSELFYPPITTVKQPMKELAQNCYCQLANMIKSRKDSTCAPDATLIKPKLAIRKSTLKQEKARS